MFLRNDLGQLEDGLDLDLGLERRGFKYVGKLRMPCAVGTDTHFYCLLSKN